MEIKLTHIDNYHSKIENLNGNYIEIDNKSDLEPKGVSPMELLLMGVAGCSSIDIISILKKQKQNFKDLRIKVKGFREKKEPPAIFKKIHANVYIDGDVDPKKAMKAADQRRENKDTNTDNKCHDNELSVFQQISK